MWTQLANDNKLLNRFEKSIEGWVKLERLLLMQFK